MAEAVLDDWVATVAEAMGLDPAAVPVDEVLALASVAAHAVVRPAAPLTTFLAGLAAGRAGASPDDVRAALAAATQVCEAHGDGA